MTFIQAIKTTIESAIINDSAELEARAERRQEKKFDKNMAAILAHQNMNMIVVEACTVGEVKRCKLYRKKRQVKKAHPYAKRIDLDNAIVLCQL
jgi:AAA15 family ATPase/GTPase